MAVRSSAKVAPGFALVLVGVALCACGTGPSAPTTQSAPDTETQKRVRADLHECNSAAGGRADYLAVNTDGKYSFPITGTPAADVILACMQGKGYSGTRVDNPMDHGGRDMIRSGGEGQARR